MQSGLIVLINRMCNYRPTATTFWATKGFETGQHLYVQQSQKFLTLSSEFHFFYLIAGHRSPFYFLSAHLQQHRLC